MLKALQRHLGGKPAEQLTIELNEAIAAGVAEALSGLQAAFDEFKTEAEAHATGLSEALTATENKLTEVQAALEAAAADKAAAEAAAQAAKLEARKEKVLGIVGTERADALLKVTEGMDDTAFEAVVAALGVGAAAEAASPLFKEAGVDVAADSAAVTETPEMKRLKAKYGDAAKKQ